MGQPNEKGERRDNGLALFFALKHVDSVNN
jgi:hypothetical protein